MNDEIHSLQRREGPVPPPVWERVVSLDESLPDVCIHREMCFAKHVQAKGGMEWLLGGLVFLWVIYVTAWTAGVIWWWGRPGAGLMAAVTLPLILISAVVHRRRGHRGRCWIVRSLDPGEIMDGFAVLVSPFVWIERVLGWILWPLLQVGRLFGWLWRCLSRLGEL
ncbi:hypothetical protein ACFFMN_11995 [Planobispora siamensis]|uniref:Uncharacterized protein n=1 Tax=Planobispora siamensis TaxID=936338 RepID=A0A8J3WIM7_9ACTN|nr:hypothetical protein [Planobispora siamensis]GIH89927.1 hypothetical protein Psi01_05570 [Planobispora siamensis]